MIQLHRQRISASFSAIGLRPDMLPMGHVLNVDHFHMSMPTFPPHPHAGFSAVTFMLPWSPGGFINRDSLGDRSPILPGALHWTLAGAGMMHEEIPENPGENCEGLQIFVKLPEQDELCTPQAHHLSPTELPLLNLPQAEIRVLVGTIDGVSSPMPNSGNTTMALVQAHGRCEVHIPQAMAAFGMGLRGSGTVGGHALNAHQAMSLPAGSVEIQGEGLDLLLAWSAPMPSTPTFRGPFCMFQADRLADAARRFRAGEMGTLAPSPGAWARG